MKNFCFTKNDINAFLEKRRSGELSYSKLQTSTEERMKFFKTFLDEKSAKEANILFEKSTLRKNRIEGYKKWIKEMSGDTRMKEQLKEKIRRNNEERMRRVFSPKEDEMFLESLVKEKLGVGVTREESAIIYKLSREIEGGKDLLNRRSVGRKMQEIIGTLDEETQKELDGFMDTIFAETMRKKEIQQSASRLKRYLGKGNKVSDEQRKQIETLVDEIVRNRKKKIEYGIAKVELDDFIGAEKLKTLDVYEGKTFKEKMQSALKELKGDPKKKGYERVSESIDAGLKLAGVLLKEGFAIAKTAASTLDASFLGRQGRVALYNALVRGSLRYVKSGGRDKQLYNIFIDVAKANYGTLFKNKQFGGKRTLKAVRQRIASRENSMNGYYDRAKLDVGTREEAFPSTFIEGVPIAKRGVIASNEAYTASAYTLRALEFDRLIDVAKKAGKKIDDDFLLSVGDYVNSMSGRGKGGIAKRVGETTNIVIFSPKFLQSTLDTLTAHQFSKSANTFVKTEARKALMSIIGGTIATLWVAKQLGAEVETDPRSSDFGKIRIGDRRFDITGGLASIPILFARTIGGIKSSTTGVVTKPDEYNGKDLVSLLADFTENKLSPGARIMVDMINNENFNREPIRDIMTQDPQKFGYIMGRDLFVPITLRSPLDAFTGETENNEEVFMSLIGFLSDFSGISSNVYSYSKDFRYTDSEEAKIMRERYPEKTVKEVSNEYSIRVNEEILKLRDNAKFRELPDKDKTRIIDDKKRKVKKEVFEKYKLDLDSDEVDEEETYTLEELYQGIE